MKIAFLNCRRVNPARDGLDLIYSYAVDDSNDIREIHVVAKLGAQIAWYMSDDEIYEYSKQVFPLVVSLINHYWATSRELPPQDFEYYEGRDLAYVRSSKLSWENFVLQLD